MNSIIDKLSALLEQDKSFPFRVGAVVKLLGDKPHPNYKTKKCIEEFFAGYHAYKTFSN